MDVSVSSILKRAQELYDGERFDDAWRVIEPVAGQAPRNQNLAFLCLALCDLENDGDARRRRIAEILGAFGNDFSFVMYAADALTSRAEQRPFDEEPLPDGAAQIAVDLLRGIEAMALRASREERIDYFSNLAMAMRMTGSQDDQAALDAMNRAIDLDPRSAELCYKIGLLHKWRGRWAEGVEANRRALTLGSDTEAVRWNLAICATGLGDLDTVMDMSKHLGLSVSRGDDGLPFGRFAPVQVRISSLGQGIDPQAHIPGTHANFENVWIERRGICHGAIVSATYHDLCADYGDVVLFDGAPVGYRVDGQSRVPRFPLLQKIRDGAYRRYRFAAVQTKGGAVKALEPRFPHGTDVYVHDEQVRWTCEDCARGEEHIDHADARESFVVTGKLIVPADADAHAFAGELQRVHREVSGIRIACPALYEALGDQEMASAERKAFDEIVSRRDAADRFVDCKLHGRNERTFVCKHLTTGEGLGFFTAQSDQRRPDAWCVACERVRIQQGGAWNDVSEEYAGIRMLCAACYDAARAKNIAPPAPPPPVKKSWWQFWK
jgi:hypothetical protein